MKKTIDNLYNSLERKKFLQNECESMVKDIIDIISNEKDISITALNQELEALGWGIGIFDKDLYTVAISLQKGS